MCFMSLAVWFPFSLSPICPHLPSLFWWVTWLFDGYPCRCWLRPHGRCPTMKTEHLTVRTTEGARSECEQLECLCFQQAAASGSQQQPASSSVVNLWQTSDVGSFGKLQRGDESSSNIERSLLSKFGSVSLSQHEQERMLSEEESSRIP